MPWGKDIERCWAPCSRLPEHALRHPSPLCPHKREPHDSAPRRARVVCQRLPAHRLCQGVETDRSVYRTRGGLDPGANAVLIFDHSSRAPPLRLQRFVGSIEQLERWKRMVRFGGQSPPYKTRT